MLQNCTSLQSLRTARPTVCAQFAARTAAVKQHSWNELRVGLRERHSRKVVWTCSDRPIICKISRSMMLAPTEKSTVFTASSTLQQGANLAGMLATVSSHDIRRGAALEYAHLLGPGSGAVELARTGVWAELELGIVEYKVSIGNGETKEDEQNRENEEE